MTKAIGGISKESQDQDISFASLQCGRWAR